MLNDPKNEDNTVVVNAISMAMNVERDWNLGDLDNVGLIKEIREVYIYEPGVNTYCCSLSPSYWLEHLRYHVIFIDGFYDRDDYEEIRDAIEDVVCYGGHDDPSGYHNVSSIDRWVENNPDHVYVDDYEYEDMEEARCSHQENHVI